MVPAVTDIAQIDAKGREQLAVSRLAMDVAGADKDRSQEPAFKNARPGQTWFGPVYFRKETEPYMSIAVRSGGESGPVTVAEVNLKFIWDVVTRIRIGQKGKAYVVDSTGHLVADRISAWYCARPTSRRWSRCKPRSRLAPMTRSRCWRRT